MPGPEDGLYLLLPPNDIDKKTDMVRKRKTEFSNKIKQQILWYSGILFEN